MSKKNKPQKRAASNRLAIFEDAEIRRILVGDDWFYSVVDVIKALTGSSNPKRYWSDIKSKENGNQSYDFIVQLKLKSSDGKRYSTDCADNEGLLRIIQYITIYKCY